MSRTLSREVYGITLQFRLNFGNGDGETSDFVVVFTLNNRDLTAGTGPVCVEATPRPLATRNQLQDRPGQPLPRLRHVRCRHLESARSSFVGAAECALQSERTPHAKIPPHNDPRRGLTTLLDSVAARLAVEHGHGAGQGQFKVLEGAIINVKDKEKRVLS